MSIQDVIAALSEEISKLQHARELLSGVPDVLPTGKRRGRPVVSEPTEVFTGKRRGRPAGSKTKLAMIPKNVKPRRTLSPEGKARIAAAQRARWAATKAIKASSKKTVSAVA